MSLVLADRVRQTSTTTGSGTFTLDGSVTGFQSFSAIGNGNTTYYTITLDSQWEVGIGTYSAGTLTRDTVISSSTGSKIAFAAGTKDVFVSYPAGKSVNQDANNRVLIPYTSGVTDVGSLNVGDATLHTDSGVIAGFTASEPLYLYTSLQNTSTANTSYASYAVNDGGHTAYGELGINNANYSYSAAGYPNNGFSAPLASFVESFGGPLVMGSWDNQKISFIINGAVSTTDAMTINTNGSIAFNGQVGTAGQVLQSNATSAPTWVNAGTGTVTSVNASVPSFLSISGNPITTSGTLAISYSGTALPVANGGTGVTTSTGTGNVVLSGSPTIVTPTINTITSAASTALTLQSGGSTAVTVDTSGNVGIGGTPSYKLDVNGTTFFRGATNVYSPTGGAVVSSSLTFGSAALLSAASIYSLTESATAGDLIFATAQSGTGTMTERMRLSPTGGVSIGSTPDPGAGNFTVSGNVGIGVTSPASKLQIGSKTLGNTDANLTVDGTSTPKFRIADLSNIALGRRYLTNNFSRPAGTFAADDAAYGVTAVQFDDGFLALQTAAAGTANPTERIRITSSGGVSFGSTGTAYGTSGQTLLSAGNAPPTWGTLGIAAGGTGQTTAGAAFNALSPITTAGDLILGDGTNTATRLAIGANGYVLTSNGTTASWAANSGGSGITTGKSIAMAMIFGF